MLVVEGGCARQVWRFLHGTTPDAEDVGSASGCVCAIDRLEEA
jgi:hypothetical protein